eukprot:5217646-Lingulodinium_polyedra.AAC.1
MRWQGRREGVRGARVAEKAMYSQPASASRGRRRKRRGSGRPILRSNYRNRCIASTSVAAEEGGARDVA